jgi:hypothetical protein
MTSKILAKFQKWSLKDNVKKLFGKLQRSFSSDKTGRAGSGSNHSSSSSHTSSTPSHTSPSTHSNHTTTPAAYSPPSSSSPQTSGNPQNNSYTPQTNNYTPASSASPAASSPPAATNSYPAPSSNPMPLPPEPDPIEDAFDTQNNTDIDNWLKDLEETDKRTQGYSNPSPQPVSYTIPKPVAAPQTTHQTPATHPTPTVQSNPNPHPTQKATVSPMKKTMQPTPLAMIGAKGLAPQPGGATQPGAAPKPTVQKSPSGGVLGSAPPPATQPQPQPTQPQPNPGGASLYSKLPKTVDKKTEFQKYPYFYPNMTGSEADNALNAQPTGTFIIRFSSQPNHLAVSYVLNEQGAINRVLIGYDNDHVWMADEPEKYNTLGDLVQAYRNVLLIAYSPSSKPNQHYRGIPNL